MSDYDREQWQAEQTAREQVETAYRDKMAKARERSAANAKRKVARLHAKLTELGHISDFEDEFGESVLERLDKFGSAFHDLEKGRAGDALSMAQKQVVARMNRKVKELKAKQKAGEGVEPDPDADYVRTADRWKTDDHKTSSFKSKRKPKFTPRVRNIEDEVFEDEPAPRPVNPAPPVLASVTAVPQVRRSKPPLNPIVTSAPSGTRPAPYIPEYVRPETKTAKPKPTVAKRPFLRIVPKD
ncbi:hypothetical protein GCM10011309_18560 [Litorimonas cladophorae]|uniref:Uncharacterized protein n=1 Tax=Litorimonas cladophorae TaxID=1220491 RepID=A0A918NI08_9PROT|nr:hypothetical protein [Litorimonas cladophorae]GGX68964.1 hypothetical protein GCM10011309_18560 [Litorimonas cladophorae]